MMAKTDAHEDLVHLEVGDPNFQTPEHIVDAAHEAAKAGQTHYTPSAGIPELRREVAKTIADETGLAVDYESELVITSGACEALHLALTAIVDPGEQVVIPSPTWASYEAHVHAVSGSVNWVPLSPETGFALDTDAVANAVTEDTAVVILTSPSNPTGKVYDESRVRDVVTTAQNHDAYVLADEVYDPFIFDSDSESITQCVGDANNVISVNSFSKRFAMTGWRVGWLRAHPEIAAAANRLHQATTSCAPAPSQHAALAGLRGPSKPLEKMQRAYRRRRDLVVDRVDTLPGISCIEPDGGFYVFLDVSMLSGSSEEIADRLATEHSLLTVPGTGFGPGGEHHLRLSYAASTEDVTTGLDRLEAFVRQSR